MFRALARRPLFNQSAVRFTGFQQNINLGKNPNPSTSGPNGHMGNQSAPRNTVGDRAHDKADLNDKTSHHRSSPTSGNSKNPDSSESCFGSSSKYGMDINKKQDQFQDKNRSGSSMRTDSSSEQSRFGADSSNSRLNSSSSQNQQGQQRSQFDQSQQKDSASSGLGSRSDEIPRNKH